jgi:membrane associated rhomboid family serine protease
MPRQMNKLDYKRIATMTHQSLGRKAFTTLG